MGVDVWPTYYLIDTDGMICCHAYGQFGIKMIEKALIRLLGKPEAE
jgi:hypothetical protein